MKFGSEKKEESKEGLRIEPKKKPDEQQIEAPLIYREGMELRKQFVMCKFFAYDYPCRWMKRYNDCRSVHDDDVRNAFTNYKEKAKRGESVTLGELRKLLDPHQKLTEDEFEVMKHLYMKYPRPPTKKEKEEIKEDEGREKRDATFSKMFKLKEAAEDE